MYRIWWDHWLSERGLSCGTLGLSDPRMRSGVLPVALAEILTGEKAAICYQKPQDDGQERENLLAAMALLRTANIPLVSANGSQRTLVGLPESVDEYTTMASRMQLGDETAVASLTWSLILFVDVGSRPDCPSKGALAELLTWARDATHGYDDVSIGFTRYAWSDAFADGMAWCALIDAHDESLLNRNALSEMGAPERRRALFSVAESQLDIPALCDADEPVDDPRVAITFTAQLRNALHARQLIAEQRRLEAAREEARAARAREQLAAQHSAPKAQPPQSVPEDAPLPEGEQARDAAIAERPHEEAPPASAAETRAADASAADTVESFDRVAAQLASGSGAGVSADHGRSVTIDVAALEAKSFSRHSVAWQLRRRRERDSAARSPEQPPRQSVFPYPLPRASSTGPATPRLEV